MMKTIHRTKFAQCFLKPHESSQFASHFSVNDVVTVLMSELIHPLAPIVVAGVQKDDVKVANTATHWVIIPVQDNTLLLIISIATHERLNRGKQMVHDLMAVLTKPVGFNGHVVSDVFDSTHNNKILCDNAKITIISGAAHGTTKFYVTIDFICFVPRPLHCLFIAQINKLILPYD